MSNSRIVLLISLKKLMRFVKEIKKVGRILVSTLAILLLCASLAESHGEGCEDDGWKIDHNHPLPGNSNLRVFSSQWGGDQDGEPITDNAHHRHYMTKDGEGPRWRFWNIFKRNWDSDTFCPQPPSPTNQNPSSESEPTNQDCDGIAAPCHVWDFHTAPWAGLPVLPSYIENMYQLWEYLQAKTGRSRLNPITIRLLIGAYWKVYRGEPDNELGEMRITPNTVINVNYSATIRFIGERVEGEEITLELPEGDTVEVYLIGFPQVPAKYKMHSDIAAIDGVDYVQRRLRGEDGRLRYVTVFDANDPNDAPIEVGQAVKIRIRKTLTLDLRGSVMGAPQAHRQHTLTTSWGAMKGVHRR